LLTMKQFCVHALIDCLMLYPQSILKVVLMSCLPNPEPWIWNKSVHRTLLHQVTILCCEIC